MADPQARRNRMTAADEIRTLAATKSWGRGRIYDSITETIGHTPLVRLNRVVPAARQGAGPPETGILQSALIRQGSHRRVDDRCARGAWPHHARRHAADRADLRQYRHWLGLRGRRQRLPPDFGDAGIDVHRAPQNLGPARRRAGADARSRRHAGGDRARRRLARELARRRAAEPVREPGQSAGARIDDGGGNLGRHQWQRRLP